MRLRKSRGFAALLAACMALIAALAVGASAANRPRSRHTATGSGTGSAAGGWHIVHLFLKGEMYDGYRCDGFASGTANNCLGPLGGDTTTAPWDGGRGAARWMRGAGGRIYIGFFKGNEYLSGWMPSPSSDRFVVTSGHMAWAGDDNVVSGDDPNKNPSMALPPGDAAAQGAPLYIGVHAYKNFVAHSGYYFDVRGWVRTAPASASRAQLTAPERHRPAGVQFVGAAGGFDPNTIASLFWELAKEPTKNFVLDQIGISTTASKLDQLKAQLAAVDKHLSQIGEQVNAAIVGLGFDAKIDAANLLADPLRGYFTQYIVPLLNDTIAVKLAEASGDEARITAAKKTYADDRRRFEELEGVDAFAKRLQSLHSLLQPGSTATGLVGQLGAKLLATKRYLTVQDSRIQDAVYNKYEEYQALAAWLLSEWNVARGHADLVPAVAKDFEQFSKEQRDPELANSLPPDLPTGVVLDRGPYNAEAITSLNKPIFTTADKDAAFWQQTPIRDSNSVPRIVESANADKLRGFSDWQIPSQDEIFGLLGVDGKDPDRTNLLKRLRDRGCPPPQRENNCVWKVYEDPGWIWTRDTASVTLEKQSYGPVTFNYTVHEAVTLSNGTSDERPRLARSGGPYEFAATEVDFIVRHVPAQVLLVRSSGTTRYF